jgi:hypothetical protein
MECNALAALMAADDRSFGASKRRAKIKNSNAISIYYINNGDS